MRLRFHQAGAALMLAGAAAALHAQTPAAGNPLDQLPKPAPIPSTTDRAPRVDGQAPAGAAAGPQDRTVTAARFDIAGVNALPFSEIANLFAPFAGKTVSVAQLVAAANQATAKYRDAGHPLSFVFLPEQNFEGGVVRVVAVEGYVAQIRIEGDAGKSRAKLLAIAAPLQREKPLRLSSFERVTQLLARMPGMTVGAEASMPGTTDGATTLVLKVARKPYNVSLGADLRQPVSRAVLTGALYDPIFPGSELNASTLVGDFRRERLLTLGYSQLVGNDGLAFKGNVTSYRGYPERKNGRGEAIERLNKNRRLDLAVSYPLMLAARSSLTLSGGFYAVDNTDDYRVRANGVTLSEDTRVRAFFAQLAYIDNQATRSRSASAMLAQGVRGLGANAETRSNVASLNGPGAARLDFTRISVDASQRDRFDNQFGTAISVGGQYSAHNLPSSERISFGGTRFGRGYSPGDAAGDSGFGIGLELNRAFKVDSDWLKQVEPYVLAEAATVNTHVGTPAPEKLRSIAVGMRFSDAKHYSIDLAFAKPTGDASLNNPAKRSRVSVTLSYQL